MDITGKVAVVTGAASGLGRATAELLSANGCRVALLDRADPSAAELRTDAVRLQVDVTDEEAVVSGLAEVEARFGRVDICVNAAGIAPAARTLGPDGPHDLALFRRTIDTNLIAVFDVARRCAEMMALNDTDENGERGVIVNVSSGAAWQGQRGQAAYAASKAALLGLMVPMAKDLASHGIRVMSVAPGPFDTAIAASMPPKTREVMENLAIHPRRMGMPSEFAQLVASIVENPYLNASTFAIDGGARMV